MTSLPTTINLVTPPGSPAPMAEDDTRDGERGKQKVKDESLPLYDSDDSVVEMSQPWARHRCLQNEYHADARRCSGQDHDRYKCRW